MSCLRGLTMTDSNVTDIGEWKSKQPEIVWECSCGNQLFYLIQDDNAFRCRRCNKIMYFEISDSK